MRRLLLLLPLALLSACGGADKVAGPKPETPIAERPKPLSGPSVSAEIGGLDEDKTRRTFEKAAKKFGRCFETGVARVPYLAGSVAFYVRITGEGSTRYAYITESTLGDRATEECMLAVLRKSAWPTPQGGDEGEARSDFTFEPGDGDAHLTMGTAEALGAPYRGAKSALRSCRSRYGAGPMKATLYVEPDGTATSIGVSTSDEKGESAVACVLDTLRGLTFPSPGASAAKVSVVID